MAERMPEEHYRFKPTPEMGDFGARMAHIVGANMRGCAAAKGETKQQTFSEAPTKAEVLAAMKESNAYCDAAIAKACADSADCKSFECSDIEKSTGTCATEMKRYYDCMKGQADVCGQTCSLDLAKCQ